jgi:hypothetical protein
MEPEIPLNQQEILALLKESNKQFESNTYIPSLNKEVHIKPMNALHLKSIIKTALAGSFVDNQFNQTMFVILKDILDPSIPTSNINIFDKISILLDLRKKNVKSTIDVEVFAETGKIIQVDIDRILRSIKKSKKSFSDQTVKDGTYEATLNFPSLDQEFIFDRDFEQTKIKKIDERNKDSMKDIPGVMFMYYLSQFIKYIKIGETNINLVAKNVQDRLTIVENLPSNLINKIIEKIDSEFGKRITEVLTVEEMIDDVSHRGVIEISPALFS